MRRGAYATGSFKQQLARPLRQQQLPGGQQIPVRARRSALEPIASGRCVVYWLQSTPAKGPDSESPDHCSIANCGLARAGASRSFRRLDTGYRTRQRCCLRTETPSVLRWPRAAPYGCLWCFVLCRTARRGRAGPGRRDTPNRPGPDCPGRSHRNISGTVVPINTVQLSNEAKHRRVCVIPGGCNGRK